MKFDIREKVKLVLTKDVCARDYDTVLFAGVVREYGFDYKTISFLSVLNLQHKGKLPSFESITRARRKCQEDFPELRGSEQAQDARLIEQETYREEYRRNS